MKFLSISLIASWALILMPATAQMAMAQDSRILIHVGKESVNVDEFLRVYKKNNFKDTSEWYSRANLEEYLELYINFRLKVQEAYSLGMDTSSAFKSELQGYRAQLAKPYLTDRTYEEELVREAYDRTLWRVRARHLLIKLPENPGPSDTLAAYRKILSLRNMAMDGISFEQLCQEHSQDPGSAQKGGDLGYFTALTMVYPFENVCYNQKPGEISQPVRTRFGYHLIQVIDRKENPGLIKVQHILIQDMGADSGDPQILADSVYKMLKGGASFEDLAAEYSHDRRTAQKGGELPVFGTGKYIAEFEDRAFGLNRDGDFSQPFLTEYGWHILKRVSVTPIAPYNELKYELRNRIRRDSRYERVEERFFNALKAEYGFKQNSALVRQLISRADTGLLKGSFQADRYKAIKGVLAEFGPQKHTVADLMAFITDNQGMARQASRPAEAMELYIREFGHSKLRAYEDTRLEQKYPEFKYLMDEYHDGILLFDLTNKKVWDKAVQDSLGLRKHYQVHIQEYQNPERMEATLYTGDLKTLKKLRKLLEKGKDPQEALALVNKKTVLVSSKSGTYTRQDVPALASQNWDPGLTQVVSSGNEHMLAHITRHHAAGPKPFEEVRGLVTASYQDFLEKEWVSELRSKYKVQVNTPVFESLIQ